MWPFTYSVSFDLAPMRSDIAVVGVPLVSSVPTVPLTAELKLSVLYADAALNKVPAANVEGIDA